MFEGVRNYLVSGEGRLEIPLGSKFEKGESRRFN